MNLIIIEDIESIRMNLYGYFAQQEEIQSVKAFDSMEDFFNEIGDNAPDIILSDIGLPGMNGIDGIKAIKKKFPETDVVMLTVFRDTQQIFKSICAGATGYLLKDSPLDDIKRAVLEIKAGGSYMSSTIARKVLEHFLPKKERQEELTAQELQIMTWLKDGHSYKMIGSKLSISHNTVRYHLKKIYRKLHINSKMEAINIVFKG